MLKLKWFSLLSDRGCCSCRSGYFSSKSLCNGEDDIRHELTHWQPSLTEMRRGYKTLYLHNYNYSTCANRSSLLAVFLSRIALPFALRASNWSDNVFSRAFSAFVLWILSIKTRLFLNTLPFTFMYMSWYMCLSIFFASRYFLNRRRRTRIRLNHRIFEGSLASLVPRLLPIIEKTEYLEIFCAIY